MIRITSIYTRLRKRKSNLKCKNGKLKSGK